MVPELVEGERGRNVSPKNTVGFLGVFAKGIAWEKLLTKAYDQKKVFK